jgi:hypothetical protein
MGIVYQRVYFASINKAANLFGVLFILQSILFAIPGVFQNKLSFRFHAALYGISGIILLLFALVIYPVVGYFPGQVYPSSPTVGLPCPATIFHFRSLVSR